MRLIYKLKALRQMWRSPRLEHAADYEVLVRMARRCAYDFRHATGFIPEKTYYLSRDEWGEMAEAWVRLFARGNPAKDYRIKAAEELDEARKIAREATDLLHANGVEVPEHMRGLELPF